MSLVILFYCASACNTDTTPTQPHRNSSTHRTKNNTTNVVIQQNSRKFLMMDILMSETCWAHKKWNKIASDIKLVFYSSTEMGPLLVVTLFYLKNILYWPDDDRLTVETCCHNVPWVYIYIYITVLIYSCVLTEYITLYNDAALFSNM